MKLQQGQIWKLDDEYIRIVHLERLAVGYKRMKDLATKQGGHLMATKKEFCKLIKKATLQDPKDFKKEATVSAPVGEAPK
jgi:hypothetical protein